MRSVKGEYLFLCTCQIRTVTKHFRVLSNITDIFSKTLIKMRADLEKLPLDT